MRAEFLPGIVLELHDANRVAFPEHSLNPDEDPLPDKTVATYLEISADARFIIDVKRTADFEYKDDCIEVIIEADGKFIGSKISFKDLSHQAYEGRRYGAGDQWQLHHFKFANLTTTEDRADETWYATAKALGEIKLKLLRCARGSLIENFSNVKSAGAGVFESGVPEKALKGRTISTHVDLQQEGVPVSIKPVFYRWTYPYGTTPIATFVFKYATREDLRKQYLIPRSPSPVPLEERDPNTLSLEEARQVVARLQQQREKAAKKIKLENNIKRERQDFGESASQHVNDDGDDDVQVVNKRRRTGDRATVDLTEDD